MLIKRCVLWKTYIWHQSKKRGASWRLRNRKRKKERKKEEEEEERERERERERRSLIVEEDGVATAPKPKPKTRLQEEEEEREREREKENVVVCRKWISPLIVFTTEMPDWHHILRLQSGQTDTAGTQSVLPLRDEDKRKGVFRYI